MTNSPDHVQASLHRERRALLQRLSRVLDGPMTALSFVWLGLMIVEFTWGLSPSLETANYVIWALFVLHFVLEFWISPDKRRYLRTNWLTALALLLPALRTLRALRAVRLLMTARVSRGVRLLRWITSLNRGMKATQRTTQGRGLKYVIVLTLLVNFAGAAGIYLFENPAALAESDVGAVSAGSGIRSYGEALWWTAMMLTTMGSDYFPRTTEGRILALLLAVYAFAIFGYITATVASLIIRVDQSQPPQHSLQQEMAELKQELARLRQSLSQSLPPPIPPAVSDGG